MTQVNDTGENFWEYVASREGLAIWEHLQAVWLVMKAAVERGIENEGVLPGGLNLPRKASAYFVKANSFNRVLKNANAAFQHFKSRYNYAA
ncbi:MAG: hypothetical protein A2087_07580 [Spirochaetes bacterium GWD1_61_31]|nr:MAG: hypothetical protein A2Y37_07890 [Spirochaetes bacterium GWB1_60_80]OHD34267.1 MAG: hypothetical protein A2004_12860 [Spirochaetes bacterium GWC1_61_12]OHD40195.1 MAG: hypothetical protein A2087_07580 [Spirochaetes bacterium GWD1_61_31]OHD45757.1 MAG: hypothetical protein A2Y35_03525 [Spirochaetes bacterium GWE1_60_18]OHD58301.1 MAG: hypothetical protein A2Y32_05915 [Spirochaetes bacterium GWF1_60_12]